MQRRGGFTLIELLIVVVILGILATIAFPSYQRYVDRSHRLAAQQVMLDSLTRAEEWRLDRRQYPTSLAAMNFTVPADVQDHFTISGAVDGSHFVVTAKPLNTQRQVEMTASSSGARAPATEW